MHQDRGEKKPKAEEQPEPQPARRRPGGGCSGRGWPGRAARGPAAPARPGTPAETEPFGDEANEIRIACIDIGGGTTDLMIAKYNFESKIDDSIRGQVLHQDGISLGGDQLVKRLLETIIVPAFAEALGLEEEDVQLLFGPEVPRNREFRAQRVNWINRLFVPLAQAYLNNAGDDVTDEPISHTDPELVDPVGASSRCNRLSTSSAARATTTPQQELDLVFEPDRVRGRGLRRLRRAACSTSASASSTTRRGRGAPGRPALEARLHPAAGADYVPLSPSRIVPMHNHYAGNWYPYQDEKGHNPGVIVDPKSPVVVGAAIEFMARHGMLPQFKFEMKGRTHGKHLLLGRDDRRHLAASARNASSSSRPRSKPARRSPSSAPVRSG